MGKEQGCLSSEKEVLEEKNRKEASTERMQRIVNNVLPPIMYMTGIMGVTWGVADQVIDQLRSFGNTIARAITGAAAGDAVKKAAERLARDNSGSGKSE